MFRSLAYTSGFLALCLAVASVAYAQQSTNRVDAKTDWSVFVEESPQKECWVVSAPTKGVIRQDGKVVTASRSAVLLFVSFRPGSGVKGEVSFTGGYPFKKESAVKMTIGNKSYDLFVQGENAWSSSPTEDAKIVVSMKKGTEAVVVGSSARGKITTDTFSLNGFTAALAEAEKRCK
jgi:invasion associated locus B (IalB) protein